MPVATENQNNLLSNTLIQIWLVAEMNSNLYYQRMLPVSLIIAIWPFEEERTL